MRNHMGLKLAILTGENYTFTGLGVGALEAAQAVKAAYDLHREDFEDLPPFDEYVAEYGEIEYFDAKPGVNFTRGR